MKAKVKFTARRLWLITLLGLLLFVTGLSYRAVYPPLPSYLKVPDGSRVQVSRRFLTFLWGPEYYCRVHSPLPARQTANYMSESLGYSEQALEATKLTLQSERMNGWELKRSGNYFAVSYFPNEIRDEGMLVYSTMRVWPEPNGSTIEFYYWTNFD
jgi:hypothetical protein